MTVTLPTAAQRPQKPDRAGPLQTLRLRLHPPVSITEPPAGVVVERDIAVPMRDGVRLRVNVFRPAQDGRFPVLVCAHPYGKDRLPQRTRSGRYRKSFQYHAMLQTTPFEHSAWTSWEAPDPAYWASRGYVVVNADLRGWGTSEGTAQVLSAQEGLDGHDLIEWAAAQPWSTGRVGMIGVSYLAMCQWAVASAAPPHLAAICPWEGLDDAYRDFGRPGGLRNDGFFRVWAFGLKAQRRMTTNLRKEQLHRPLRDDWWDERDRDLESITAPALVCASFSDHDLHSRGTFNGFRRINSEHKWLYTHRGPKWATFYSPQGHAVQAQFFDHFLRNEDTGILGRPPVRVEIREDTDTITAIREVAQWPPEHTRWTTLHLASGTAPATGVLNATPSSTAGTVHIGGRGRPATFVYRFDRETEIVGPMSLHLPIELPRGGDVSVYATVRKFRDGREVTFEGSYGSRWDAVTHGMLAASLRAVDPSRSRPGQPFHPFTKSEPLRPGETATLDIELAPSATLFRAGEELRLDIGCRWPFARNPLTGIFPAVHQAVGHGPVIVHVGGAHHAALTVPVWSQDEFDH
jgi:predicted acyl esterase